jgi:hypothetical protein|tara:strand:+ start:152 stop:301 length:150 start_codon:yes stop_codon:yes gene_type:complete
LNEILVVNLSQLSPMSVITMEDLEAQLGRESLKDLMGCDAVTCAAEIGA